MDSDGQVHKNCREGTFFRLPIEAMKVAETGLKAIPGKGVIQGVTRGYPDAEDVIDETAIEEEVIAEFVEEGVFKDDVEEGGVWWGRWCSHRGTREL